MAITSSLAEFSLPELFQFLDQGNKTGLLTLRFKLSRHSQEIKARHILLRQGRILAVSHRLDNQCLLKMMCQRGWLSPEVINEQVNRCPANKPIGLYLKTKGFLHPEQLRLLFHAQVLRSVCGLFRLKDAKFRFDSKATLATIEMTGLSISATKATLIGLRALPDWTGLADKLPETSSALSRAMVGHRQLGLDPMEAAVWKLANGSIPLTDIATRLGKSLETVQQISYRLISVGLVAEVPMLTSYQQNYWQSQGLEPVAVGANRTEEDNPQELSNRFVQHLLGFLRR